MNYIRNFLKGGFPKNLVLIYHRVANLDSDPQQLAVTPENFDTQIAFLKKNYNVIPLQELVTDLKKGKLKNNSVVITFDDGYYDNYQFAKPILESHGVPATIFVLSGHLNTEREFWWDEIERLILGPATLPTDLALKVDGHSMKFAKKDIEDRKAFYDKLFLSVRYERKEYRDKILKELRAWVGVSEIGRKTHRSMTTDELVLLSQSKVIEIGAHTVNHPVLSTEEYQTQENEILGSKKTLESILKKEILSFSYPFGTDGEVNDLTRSIVRESGYNCAIANIQKVCTVNDDPYWIPRKLVRNWNIEEFTNKLNTTLWA